LRGLAGGAPRAGDGFFRTRGELARDFPRLFVKHDSDAGRALAQKAEVRGDYELGEWGHVIRTLADYDPDALERVLHWPIREGLMAYQARLRREAAQRYSEELTIWAILAPHTKKRSKPPQRPRILSDD
jgi:hypothetical protein